MHSTRRDLALGHSFLTAAIACHRTPVLEEIPAVTEVMIEMQDGRRVTGFDRADGD